MPINRGINFFTLRLDSLIAKSTDTDEGVLDKCSNSCKGNLMSIIQGSLIYS